MASKTAMASPLKRRTWQYRSFSHSPRCGHKPASYGSSGAKLRQLPRRRALDQIGSCHCLMASPTKTERPSRTDASESHHKERSSVMFCQTIPFAWRSTLQAVLGRLLQGSYSFTISIPSPPRTYYLGTGALKGPLGPTIWVLAGLGN